MRASFGIDVGLLGFGVEGGLFPSLSLGLIRFWFIRGSTIGDRLAALHAALGEAKALLRENAGRDLPHD